MNAGQLVLTFDRRVMMGSLTSGWVELFRVEHAGELRCLAATGPADVWVGGSARELFHWDGRVVERHEVRDASGWFTQLEQAPDGLYAGTSGGEVVADLGAGFRTVCRPTAPSSVRSLRSFNGVLYVAVGPLSPYFTPRQRDAGQLFKEVGRTAAALHVAALDGLSAEGLEVAAGRLWVVGPHRLLHSTDGVDFSPVAFR